MRRGGRIAQDFSAIPPKGRAITRWRRTAVRAAIMNVSGAILATIVETDVSFIAGLSCNHPDIEDFVGDGHAAIPVASIGSY